MATATQPGWGCRLRICLPWPRRGATWGSWGTAPTSSAPQCEKKGRGLGGAWQVRGGASARTDGQDRCSQTADRDAEACPWVSRSFGQSACDSTSPFAFTRANPRGSPIDNEGGFSQSPAAPRAGPSQAGPRRAVLSGGAEKGSPAVLRDEARRKKIKVEAARQLAGVMLYVRGGISPPQILACNPLDFSQT